MPTRLPLDRLLVPVRQIGEAVSASRLARHVERGTVVLPLEPSAADWQALPHGAVLRALLRAQDPQSRRLYQLRVGAHAQTLLVVACVAAAGDRPSSACKLPAKSRALRWKASRRAVLLWQRGCALDAADATFHALIAALEAAAFRFATFKSKPKPRARLLSIDLALAWKVAASSI